MVFTDTAEPDTSAPVNSSLAVAVAEPISIGLVPSSTSVGVTMTSNAAPMTVLFVGMVGSRLATFQTILDSNHSSEEE